MSTAVVNIRDRIRALAEDRGGVNALARATGLAPSTISQYLSEEHGRTSEPGVEALVKLARGANVSISWLATGEGSRRPSDPPEGYVWVPRFDLAATGATYRTIRNPPTDTVLFRQDQLVGALVDGGCIMVHGGDGDDTFAFEPEIRAGDYMLVAVPKGHQPERVSSVESWTFIKERAIYLVADGFPLKLRRLRRQRRSVVQVIRPDGSIEKTLTGAPPDFTPFGRVIWRAGILPDAKLS